MPTTIPDAFAQLLAAQQLTPHDVQLAQSRSAELIHYVTTDRAFDLAERPVVVGSYARGTLCRPERDLDLLVPFVRRSTTSDEPTSRVLLAWLRDQLDARYGVARLSARQGSVKLDFPEIVLDVVPCLPRPGGGYLLPDGHGQWLETNPLHHAALMAKAGRGVTALVQLLQAWNRANGGHLRSFHLELLVEAIKRGAGVGDWADEVRAVLLVLPQRLRYPMRDPWPAGGLLDEYLSFEKRQLVIRLLEAAAQAATQAEAYRRHGHRSAAFERWNVVYRQTFPAFG